MKFIVTTQGLENYGSHCEDGKFSSGNHYWKFKSGTEYIVSGLERPQDAMAFVAAIGLENGIGWKEFPSEVITENEWEAQWDLNDEFDREHREFKLGIMVAVDPRDPETYKRFLAR
jgi:hypothetical protein